MNRFPCQFALALSALCSAGTFGGSAAAATIVFNLGQSAENYTLTGTGGSGGYGTYNNTQGACSSASGLTTCNLTGAFTGNTSGLDSGSYDFQTTYAAGTTYFPVQSISVSPQGGPNFDLFTYNYFDPSLTMTLDVTDAGLTYSFPLVSAGSFTSDLAGISFAYVNAVCGGTSLGNLPCSQGNVGLVSGATLSGQITGTDTLNLPAAPTPVTPPSTVTPEPGWLSLSGLPMLGYVLRRRKLNYAG